MPLPAKAIKGKIGAVKNIGKITKAMELVSVSKMKKAVDQALRARPYAERALEILVNISRERALKHPLFEHGDQKRNLIVIMSSNKGLCGSYNVNVSKGLRKFLAKIHAKHESEVDFITIGKRSEKIARSLGGKVIASFLDLPEEVHFDETQGLRKIIREEFLSGNYYNVVLVYTNFISAISNEVRAKQMLPVKIENIENMIDNAGSPVVREHVYEDFSNYILEPNEEEVLAEVLRELSEIQVFQALLEARASEHSSRMVAMKSATDNAKKLADELTLTYNQARQASITREISEISAGAEALST